jgi:hypothetical protein
MSSLGHTKGSLTTRRLSCNEKLNGVLLPPTRSLSIQLRQSQSRSLGTTLSDSRHLRNARQPRTTYFSICKERFMFHQKGTHVPFFLGGTGIKGLLATTKSLPKVIVKLFLTCSDFCSDFGSPKSLILLTCSDVLTFFKYIRVFGSFSHRSSEGRSVSTFAQGSRYKKQSEHQNRLIINQ